MFIYLGSLEEFEFWGYHRSYAQVVGGAIAVMCVASLSVNAVGKLLLKIKELP